MTEFERKKTFAFLYITFTPPLSSGDMPSGLSEIGLLDDWAALEGPKLRARDSERPMARTVKHGD